MNFKTLDQKIKDLFKTYCDLNELVFTFYGKSFDFLPNEENLYFNGKYWADYYEILGIETSDEEIKRCEEFISLIKDKNFIKILPDIYEFKKFLEKEKDGKFSQLIHVSDDLCFILLSLQDKTDSIRKKIFLDYLKHEKDSIFDLRKDISIKYFRKNNDIVFEVEILC